MNKIKLELENLSVVSFDTGPNAGMQGTVEAHSGFQDCVGWSQVGGWSCGGTCEYTCDCSTNIQFNSCNGGHTCGPSFTEVQTGFTEGPERTCMPSQYVIC